MTAEKKPKRAALKGKISTAQKRNADRNADRSLTDYARDAGSDVTSFVKQHPITTVVGGLALGVLVASLVPGRGRQIRKQATKRGAVMAGVLADLALTYGKDILDGAGKAARTGQDRLGDLGSTLGDGARDASREAGSFTREAGERAVKTLRDLRSRMAN